MRTPQLAAAVALTALLWPTTAHAQAPSSAGTFMMPLTPSIVSNGEWRHWYGMSMPTYSSTLLKYSLQAMATVAAPTAYSRTRSQPMIQATSSPIVAYE